MAHIVYELIYKSSYDDCIEYIKGYPLDNEDDKVFYRKNIDTYHKFLNDGYKVSGLGNFSEFQSHKDFKRKCSMFYAAYYKNELVALSVHNDYLGSHKCVGMTAVPRDVSEELHKIGIEALYHMIQDSVDNWSEWVWAETSMPISHMYEKKGAFAIPDELAIEMLTRNFSRNTNIELLSDGYHYKQEIEVYDQESEDDEKKTKLIKATKIVYGFNSQETYEKYLKYSDENFSKYPEMREDNEELNESFCRYTKEEFIKYYMHMVYCVEDWQNHDYCELPGGYLNTLAHMVRRLERNIDACPKEYRRPVKTYLEDAKTILATVPATPRKGHNLIKTLKEIGFFNKQY